MHDRLRQATKGEHDRVDAAYAGFDLSTRPGYLAFLEAHRRAYWRLEPSWRPEDRPEFEELARTLDADLDALAAHPARPAAFTRLDGLAVAYVTRGSRLGAAVLKGRVGPDLPAQYLRHAMAQSWSDFARELNATVPGRSVIDDARTAFSAFLPIGS